ncbi:putative tetraacyldisaccharide 4'-kinase [Rosa chinensis]|uniref:tetraacyldisaccharide 4'-kinase n=1 Tax=Rosa chinensis TaxID=74649 RepID=A0A2P6QZ12_ROSCH|nr:putative tetraacyldisaccharide 4'-kinase [Rosa chinensis]
MYFLEFSMKLYICAFLLSISCPNGNDYLQIGAFFVYRLEFSDHHKFLAKDIEMIKRRLRVLEDRFSSKPVVIVTEKDYDRDPNIFKYLGPFEVLALCSELKIIPNRGYTEYSFKKLLTEVCT